ncbi:hypothetical protein [Caulobacter sp.]|uniref:hypothetical protein n=1 Tax=Caulobacter sp. TaxID=78 RepID=UPI0016127D11
MKDGSAMVGATLRAGLSDVTGAVKDCWVALALAAALGVASNLLPPGLRLPAAVLAGVIAQGALFRRAFGRQGGLKGLRWGRDEWRLLGAQLMILALFLLIGAILMIIVGGVSLGIARTASPDFDASTTAGWKAAYASAGPAGFVVALVPLAAFAILLWLGLRLSLSAPATVDQAGVRVLSAFPLTKGYVPVLLAVGVVIVLPVVLVSTAMRFAPQGFVVAAILAVCAYFYAMPAWAGALAHVYRRRAALQDA